MKPKEYRKVPLNTRVSEDIMDILQRVTRYIKMEKRDYIELAILDFTEKLDKNKYCLEGLDFIEYAKLRKKRIARQMQGIFRTEIKSKNLVLNNIRRDIMQLLIAGAPLSEIKKLLLARKLEVLYYEDSEKIVEKIDEYLQIKEVDYKKTITYLREEISNDRDIEQGETRVLGLLNKGVPE